MKSHRNFCLPEERPPVCNVSPVDDATAESVLDLFALLCGDDDEGGDA